VTFWELFFTLMIFIPLIMLWVFALVDVFQNNALSGAAKALWAIAIVLLPIIGMLIYFIVQGTDDANEAAPAPPPPAPKRRPATPAPAPAAAGPPPGGGGGGRPHERRCGPPGPGHHTPPGLPRV
jgi:hypothetical protein